MGPEGLNSNPGFPINQVYFLVLLKYEEQLFPPEGGKMEGAMKLK